MSCWSCGQPPAAVLEASDVEACASCGALPPPDPARSHFQRMGLEPRLDLDDALLARRFRELSRKCHPDRHVNGPAGNRRLALEHATAINDAYRVLREPARRAEYLLGLLGVAVDERTGGSPALLMEVMELREEVDEARHDPERGARLSERIARDRDGCLAAIGEIAATGALPADVRARDRARDALVRLKFLESALRDIAARTAQGVGA